MNLRPSGYEPDELPGCSTPRYRMTEDGSQEPGLGWVAAAGLGVARVLAFRIQVPGTRRQEGGRRCRAEVFVLGPGS